MVNSARDSDSSDMLKSDLKKPEGVTEIMRKSCFQETKKNNELFSDAVRGSSN